MKEPLVYIVIVNYNGYDDTIECIKSLKDIQYSNYKIVLVENASKDKEKIQSNSFINENAIVLFSDINGGFSAGNNIGIEYALNAGADYVLLLNNDTAVDKDFLNSLVEIGESDSSIGIVTGDIYYYFDKTKLWYSNGRYDRGSGITQMCVKTEKMKNNVSFACGCLMLLKRKMLEEIGLLEDLFFLYSEDTEYCCRAIDSGWGIVWTSESKIYHKISVSTGENSDFQQYYLTRNNLVLTKMYGKRRLYGYIKRLWYCLKDILKGRSNIGPVWFAYVDFVKMKYGKTDRY